MGCTPSIHVSHTGVIYCQDSDESPTSYSATNHQLDGGLNGRLQSVAEVTPETTDTSGHTTGGSGCGGGVHRLNLPLLPPPIIKGGGYPSSENTSPKGEFRDIEFGPMKFKWRQMKVLLVFGREDAQSKAFKCAIFLQNHLYDITTTFELAKERYSQKRHDIVIIDNRHHDYFDPEALCREIRRIEGSDHTVMVAIVDKNITKKEAVTIVPLLDHGYDRMFVESPNYFMCENELIQLARSVSKRVCLRASTALFTALNHCQDAVEITNAHNEIQYVNDGCEKLLGYSREELLGKNIQDFFKNEHLSMFDSINTQLNNNKEWEGTIFVKPRQGDVILVSCQVIPITQGSNNEHRVYIKRLETNRIPNGKESHYISSLDPHTESFRSLRRASFDLKSLRNELGVNRRQSMARSYLTQESPIMKVISIIRDVIDDCPIHVAQDLDKVLGILRTPELFSPNFFGAITGEDPVATDFLGGLLSQTPRPIGLAELRRRSNDSTVSKDNINSHKLSTAFAAYPSNLKAILENEGKWDFDVLALERVTDKKPLVFLGMVVMARYNAFEILKCSESTLQNWLNLIEAKYHSQNTYHNSTHAADVLQATAYFLEKDRLKEIFSPVDAVACLIAAVVHDVDHPGRNNKFLCNSNHELAILYNDQSVLENHHASLAFKVTGSDDRVNIFKNVDRETYNGIRQTVIDMVLATDMNRHFEYLSKVVNICTKPAPRDGDFMSDEMPREAVDLNALCENERMDAIQAVKRIVIKCADVSNPVRPLHLCKEWADRIAEEYYAQTDEEKKLGLPIVMPHFDRTTCCVPKTQTGFIDLVIDEMFKVLNTFVSVPELMELLQENYQYWEQQLQSSTKDEHEGFEEQGK